jgi:molybdopterin-containing oxidoreductase family membrane subunit
MYPDVLEFATLAGSFGLFFTMFCLFARFLPVVATAEVKTALPQADPSAPAARGISWAAEAPVEALS